MAGIAIVFSGQGAQVPGMGRSLYETSPAARQVFDRVDALRPGTAEQCFSGTAETLAETINTQPCLWAMEMAAAAALRSGGAQFSAAAGFSVGELAALTFSGAADFDTGFQLVCRRAERMAAASAQADTAMAAVMKLDAAAVERLCADFPHVWPVNYNCPGQITVSGLRAELEQFVPAVKAAGGIAKLLKVSGAFHSPLMQPAAEQFGAALDAARLAPPRMTLYSNYTGAPYGTELKTLLARQISNPVRWQTIIEHMTARGIDTFVEAGPGKTLCGLIARTVPTARTLPVSDAETLEETLEVLKTC